MRSTVAGALALLLFGCGSPSGTSSTSLQLVVSDTPVELAAGETLRVKVLVIGDGSSSAVLSSPDLPPFATLQGTDLTLSPTRSHEGDYAFTLVATASTGTASAVFHLRVSRSNTPPRLLSAFSLWDGDRFRLPFVCPGPACTVSGIPGFVAFMRDDEGDDLTLELEVAPLGQPFTGVATHSITVPSGHDEAGVCQTADTCVRLQMPGLVAGSDYHFTVRLRDALGAWGGVSGPAPSDGWLFLPDGLAFEQGPCPSGATCRCVQRAGPCFASSECCSGVCSGSDAQQGQCL